VQPPAAAKNPRVLASEVEPPQEIRTVQIAALPDPTEIATLITLAKEAGWDPVFVPSTTQTQALQRVCVGRYETIADAFIAKNLLRNSGYPDAFMVTLPNPQGSTATSANRGPGTKIFIAPKGFARRFADLPPGLSKVRVGGKEKSVEEVLRGHWSASSQTEEESNELITELLPIANGEVQASQAHVARARMNIGHSYQYRRGGQNLAALQSYTEALEVAEPGSVEEAECLVERAALLMQLARSGKGTMEEVRRACRIAERRIAPERNKFRATAALMNAETLLIDKRWEEGLAALQAIQNQYRQQRREHLAATLMSGVALLHLNRTAEAEGVFRQMLATPVDTKDQFFSVQKPGGYHSDAALWLAHIAYRRGDEVEAQRLKRYSESLAQAALAQHKAHQEAGQ